MAAPSITVVNTSDRTVVNWDAGICQANNDSGVLTILVWNNRGGGEALSDLNDCNITSLDVDGGSTSDVVAGKWVRVNCPVVDGNSTTWTQVGGDTVKYFRADGITASENVLSGAINDGNKSTAASKKNYSTLNLKVHVPLNATPGMKSYKMRINGYYI